MYQKHVQTDQGYQSHQLLSDLYSYRRRYSIMQKVFHFLFIKKLPHINHAGLNKLFFENYQKSYNCYFLLISKSLIREFALCWDSRPFERFVDFYLGLFFVYLFERQSAMIPEYDVKGSCTFEVAFFLLSRLFEIWFQSQGDIDYDQVTEYFWTKTFSTVKAPFFDLIRNSKCLKVLRKLVLSKFFVCFGAVSFRPPAVLFHPVSSCFLCFEFLSSCLLFSVPQNY